MGRVSSNPTSYGQWPVLALLWLENSTDQTQSVMTCDGIDWFWLYGIDVFDSLRLARAESRRREREAPSARPVAVVGPVVLQGISRFKFSSHTLVHGSFSKPAYDFTRDLAGVSIPRSRRVNTSSCSGESEGRTLGPDQKNAIRSE